MDRFIDNKTARKNKKELFKIQYGQIYRAKKLLYAIKFRRFKIQYGQIYR